jgi:hypothetical protein
MAGARGASVSQFVLLTDPFWLQKIITDPHALSQVWCPDDGYPKLKIYYVSGLILDTRFGGPGSVLGIATGYGLDGLGIESRWGRVFPHLSRPALRPIQSPVQWVPGLSRV